MAKSESTIFQIQKQAIESALSGVDGNRTHASKVLGVSVRTVRNWIRRYSLEEKFPPIRHRPK